MILDQKSAFTLHNVFQYVGSRQNTSVMALLICFTFMVGLTYYVFPGRSTFRGHRPVDTCLAMDTILNRDGSQYHAKIIPPHQLRTARISGGCRDERTF